MQNQSELLSIDTVITKSQDKGSQILIEDDKRDYYSFFKNKQDNSPTAAFSSFQQFAVGQPVTIVYKHVPYKGKNLRSVVKFRAVDPNRPSAPRATFQQEAPSVSQAPSQFDQIARWGHANHPTYWAFIVSKYKEAHQPALQPPVIPTSGDEINVEDIPF